MPIDLTPGRKNLGERYGVEAPSQSLRRILAERLGPDVARAILADQRAAEERYGRAVRVEQIRRRHLTRPAPDMRAWPPRAVAAWRRQADILAHAEAYIAGDWIPDPPGAPGYREP